METTCAERQDLHNEQGLSLGSLKHKGSCATATKKKTSSFITHDFKHGKTQRLVSWLYDLQLHQASCL